MFRCSARPSQPILCGTWDGAATAIGSTLAYCTTGRINLPDWLCGMYNTYLKDGRPSPTSRARQSKAEQEPPPPPPPPPPTPPQQKKERKTKQSKKPPPPPPNPPHIIVIISTLLACSKFLVAKPRHCPALAPRLAGSLDFRRGLFLRRKTKEILMCSFLLR